MVNMVDYDNFYGCDELNCFLCSIDVNCITKHNVLKFLKVSGKLQYMTRLLISYEFDGRVDKCNSK